MNPAFWENTVPTLSRLAGELNAVKHGETNQRYTLCIIIPMQAIVTFSLKVKNTLFYVGK